MLLFFEDKHCDGKGGNGRKDCRGWDPVKGSLFSSLKVLNP